MDPGDKYWDVFAFDVYDKGYDPSWYEYILPITEKKPIAIGECAKLPDREMLETQPRRVFFMPWAELVKSSNTEQEIRQLYKDPRVITRDEMPGWSDGINPVSPAYRATEVSARHPPWPGS